MIYFCLQSHSRPPFSVSLADEAKLQPFKPHAKMTAANDANKPTEVREDCYIDGEAGADERSADGSSSRPFKTLGYAYIQNIDKPTKRYLIHTLDASQLVWKEPSKSAVKKA